MSDDSPLSRIAADLRLTIIRPLVGGVWGATLVSDANGQELVLKTMPTEMWPKVFERGASLANRLRSQGYPAPEYIGTGAAHGATWSLQHLLPGAIPDRMNEPQMRQLLALAERQSGAVPEGGSAWLRHQMPYAELALQTITDLASTRELALELRAVIARTKDVVLLEDGVVHNDFHHRNFLAQGDDVTGVFDWEFADVGDWRYDLVTLAWWCVRMRFTMPAAVVEMAVERMRSACPPDVMALFAAVRTVSQLDFDARTNPEFVPGLIADIESHLGAWWRGAVGGP
jgi:hypothetical protein